MEKLSAYVFRKKLLTEKVFTVFEIFFTAIERVFTVLEIIFTAIEIFFTAIEKIFTVSFRHFLGKRELSFP